MIDGLNVQLFVDGAYLNEMVRYAAQGHIDGFTTNPTLLCKAGVTRYREFASEAARLVAPKPISLEVVTDDLLEMEVEARYLSRLGTNIYVKIPITTTFGQSTLDVVHRLSLSGVNVNITAILTYDQIRDAIEAVGGLAPAIVSVFAGRIADTGRDPVSYMTMAATSAARFTNVETLWASPREVFNVYQAAKAGVDIITATPDILKKLALRDKDLAEYSRETVQMFYADAQAAGLSL